MKKRIRLSLLLSLLFLINSSYTLAQNPTLSWAKQMGLGGSDIGHTSITDHSGNIYTIGQYQGPVDFDPSSGNSNTSFSGYSDIFIQKLDAGGNFLWVKQVGGPKIDIGYDITTDLYGNVYATGYFTDSADFDPSASTFMLTSHGNSDIFVLKLSANGNFIWAKNMGGSSYDGGISLKVDSLGNVYTAGSFRDTIDLDPNSNTSFFYSDGNTDNFIVKLDSNGNYLWGNRFGNGSFDNLKDLAIDRFGNAIVCGEFYGTIDFDPGIGVFNLSSNGGADTYLLKLDANGNFMWANNKGWNFNEEGNGLATDNAGNIYSTGIFFGTIDCDPGVGVFNLTSNSGVDAYIQKLDANGNFIWAKKVGGSSQAKGYNIAVDALNQVYVSGQFIFTANFNTTGGVTNLTSAGAEDIFILKLAPSGTLLWAKNIGGSQIDKSNSIDVDFNGNIISTGFFNGTADFDPSVANTNLTSAGLEDIFIQKLTVSSIGIKERNISTTITIHPNPSSNEIIMTGLKEGNVHISITTVSGKPILEIEGNSLNNQKVDISALKKGVYNIQVTQEGLSQALKIVKN